MQQLSKVQTDALRKARREAAKAQKRHAASDLVLDPDLDDSSKDPDLQDEGSLEGVGLLLVCRSNSQVLSKYARRAAASNPAAAAAIARAGSISDPDPPSAEDSNLGLAFYIPLEPLKISNKDLIRTALSAGRRLQPPHLPSRSSRTSSCLAAPSSAAT